MALFPYDFYTNSRKIDFSYYSLNNPRERKHFIGKTVDSCIIEHEWIACRSWVDLRSERKTGSWRFGLWSISHARSLKVACKCCVNVKQLSLSLSILI
jgi:hypothetical protein